MSQMNKLYNYNKYTVQIYKYNFSNILVWMFYSIESCNKITFKLCVELCNLKLYVHFFSPNITAIETIFIQPNI